MLKCKELMNELDKLHVEVCDFLEEKYNKEDEVFDFDCNDTLGDIVDKSKISNNAILRDDGLYVLSTCHYEDWYSGAVYVPLNDNEYLEVSFDT